MAASLITLLVLLVLSALSAASEIALLSIDQLKLEAAERSGSRVARLIKLLRSRPQRILTTLLIVNNVVNTAITALATLLIADYIIPASTLPREYMQPLAIFGIALVITILGDLIPKTVGAVNNNAIAGFMGYPLYFIDRLLAPVHWLLGFLVTPLVRLLTGGKSELADIPTREDMRVALTLAHASGQLHSMDLAVAQEALHFSTISLRDVMTPRVDMTAVEDTVTVAEALHLMRTTGYSRLPVYHEGPDQIAGVVLVKDLMQSFDDLLAGRLPVAAWSQTPVTQHMREVAFFPETKSVVDSLAEIRTLRSHLAVVVDEHGGTAGIVTLEDMIEELIGDIRDESDPDHSSDVIKRGEGYCIISGRARLDLLAEMSGRSIEELGLAEIDASTVGGLVMERLGRPAVKGDEIEVPPLKVAVLRIQRNRIKLMRVESSGPPPADNGNGLAGTAPG